MSERPRGGEHRRPALGVYIAVFTAEIGFSAELAVAMPQVLSDEVPGRNPINVPASVARATAATIHLTPQQAGVFLRFHQFS
jgi:hypothetical protein